MEEERKRFEKEREEEEEESNQENDDDEIPEQLRSHSDIKEICNWLVDKWPDILNLASQMLEAKKSILPSSSSDPSTSGLSASSQQVYSIIYNSCYNFLFIINIL